MSLDLPHGKESHHRTCRDEGKKSNQIKYSVEQNNAKLNKTKQIRTLPDEGTTGPSRDIFVGQAAFPVGLRAGKFGNNAKNVGKQQWGCARSRVVISRPA